MLELLNDAKRSVDGTVRIFNQIVALEKNFCLQCVRLVRQS